MTFIHIFRQETIIADWNAGVAVWRCVCVCVRVWMEAGALQSYCHSAERLLAACGKPAEENVWGIRFPLQALQRHLDGWWKSNLSKRRRCVTTPVGNVKHYYWSDLSPAEICPRQRSRSGRDHPVLVKTQTHWRTNIPLLWLFCLRLTSLHVSIAHAGSPLCRSRWKCQR